MFLRAQIGAKEKFMICLNFIINHPNLKRILMPDDWYGHPLLKTYPLQGDEFAQWYEIDKIFGKEYREVVGVEQRDPGFADDKDTLNFARLYHEVPKGGSRKEVSLNKSIKKMEALLL